MFTCGIKPHVFVALHLFKEEWKKRIPNPDCIDILCSLTPTGLKNHGDFKKVESLIKQSDYWGARERFYFLAKMTCHSCNYDIKWPTFQSHVLEKSEGQIVLENHEAKNFINFYRMLLPEIPQWHFETQIKLKNNGRKLFNLFGHPRQFNESWGDTLFKQAYAFIPQSTVGQITNYALCEIHEDIEAGKIWTSGVDALQNGHDSVLGQCGENTKEVVGREIKRKLERDLVSPNGTKFRMKSEVQWGYNWGPKDEKKNPLGMRDLVLD
jgi:hypothetical protein